MATPATVFVGCTVKASFAATSGVMSKGTNGAGQTGVGRGDGVAGAGLVDRQVAEGGDAVDGRYRGRAAERAAAGIGADRDGDGGVVAGHDVAEAVQHADDGGADGTAGDGRGRLHVEGERLGRRRVMLKNDDVPPPRPGSHADRS